MQNLENENKFKTSLNNYLFIFIQFSCNKVVITSFLFVQLISNSSKSEVNKNLCSSIFQIIHHPSSESLNAQIDVLVNLYIDTVFKSNHNKNKTINSDLNLNFGDYKSTLQNSKLMKELKSLQIVSGSDSIVLFYQKLNRKLKILKVNQREFSEEIEKTKEYEKYKLQFDKYYQDNIKFHPIRPRKFMMGDVIWNSQVEVELTQPFEMMATQVTQKMWATLQVLIGETDSNIINPAYFKTGTESMIVHIGGIDIQMKPNHPVEMVSYYAISDFLKGLNNLSANGDEQTQHLLIKLMPGHQKGDVYDLPTEAQWEFVMRNRGHANKLFFDRDDSSDTHNYAWYYNNSDGQTHAVATRQPRMINGKPFFDLEGNVWEWTKDEYIGKLLGGKDPLVGTPPVYIRSIRGSNFQNQIDTLRSGNRHGKANRDASENTGLRLVRTRP